MGNIKIICSLILGLGLLFLITLSCSSPDEWQDHIYKDDDILGGLVTVQAVTWEGEWTLTYWWAQDESGTETEGEAHEGYIKYNPDGTCEFKIFDDGPFTANYLVTLKITHNFGDEWWDGPWWVKIDLDKKEMRWFFGDSLFAGEGEGYIFTMEDTPPELWLGEWTLTTWWAQDETGTETESEPHEGYVKYNSDGTAEFKIFEDDPITGNFDAELKVSHTFGDDWWDGPWFMEVTLKELKWFTGPFDGEGEGYLFEKAE